MNYKVGDIVEFDYYDRHAIGKIIKVNADGSIITHIKKNIKISVNRTERGWGEDGEFGLGCWEVKIENIKRKLNNHTPAQKLKAELLGEDTNA